MQTKNLIKIIKAEATVLNSMIDGLPDDGDLQEFEVIMLQNKIRDIGNIAAHLLPTEQATITTAKLPETPAQKPIIDNLPPVVTNSTAIEKATDVVETPVDSAVATEPTTTASTAPSTTITEKKSQPTIAAEPIIDNVQAFAENAPTEVAEPLVTEEQAAPIEVVEEDIETKAVESSAIPEPTSNVGSKGSLADMFANNTMSVAETYVEPTTEQVTTEATAITPEPISNVEHKAEAEQAVEKNEPKPTILADRFSQNSPSINDVMAGVENRTNLATRYNSQPIVSLRKNIKINDRTRFVNELFASNFTDYETMLDAIDNANDFNDAVNKIFSRYAWDQQNETVADFLELVYLRFKK